MSEQAPQSNPYERQEGSNIYRLTIGTEIIDLHCHNTQMYAHTVQPEGDHIFIARGHDGDGDTIGSFLWRESFVKNGTLADYEEVVEILGKIECGTRQEQFMTPEDQERFYTYFGRYPKTEGIDTLELSDRNEELVAKFGKNITAILSNAPQLFWDEMAA